jgi:hypothetical protein
MAGMGGYLCRLSSQADRNYLWQEREPQSEWHEERKKASNDFRKVVENQPKDVRKVVAALKVSILLFSMLFQW